MKSTPDQCSVCVPSLVDDSTKLFGVTDLNAGLRSYRPQIWLPLMLPSRGSVGAVMQYWSYWAGFSAWFWVTEKLPNRRYV